MVQKLLLVVSQILNFQIGVFILNLRTWVKLTKISLSKKGDITTIKIEVINSDLNTKTLNTYIELITEKGFEYKTTCKKGMKDLILDAGALDVIVKTWNIELVQM